MWQSEWSRCTWWSLPEVAGDSTCLFADASLMLWPVSVGHVCVMNPAPSNKQANVWTQRQERLITNLLKLNHVFATAAGNALLIKPRKITDKKSSVLLYGASQTHLLQLTMNCPVVGSVCWKLTHVVAGFQLSLKHCNLDCNHTSRNGFQNDSQLILAANYLFGLKLLSLFFFKSWILARTPENLRCLSSPRRHWSSYRQVNTLYKYLQLLLK